MNKKTILYIEFLEDTAANHLLMIIKSMKKYNNYSFIFLCQKESFLVGELKNIGIKRIYEFDYIASNKLTRWFKNIAYLYLLFFILLKHKINIIHSHRLQWAYIAVIAAVVLHIPLFIHVVVIEKPINILKKYIIKHISLIKFIAVSENARKQFIQLNSVNSKRIFSYYGGVYFPDIELNKNIQIPILEELKQERKIVIGMISRMDPLKGVDVFIEAAGILAQEYPNLHFVHIGNQMESSPYFYTCRLRVSNLNIVKKFTFIDYIDNSLPYFKYFYLTALPSYRDTLAYVNLESNAFGVPTISTDVGGIPETIVSKKLCLIPFPPSPFILADRISELLNNKKVYLSLQKKVKQNVFMRFNSEKNVEQLNKLYQEESK